jgi:hypothetical protein
MRKADMYGAYRDGELKKYLHTTSYIMTQAETKISAPATYPHILLNFFNNMGIVTPFCSKAAGEKQYDGETLVLPRGQLRNMGLPYL